MTTRHASLPTGRSVIRLMAVTTVLARTWSESEASLGSKGLRGKAWGHKPRRSAVFRKAARETTGLLAPTPTSHTHIVGQIVANAAAVAPEIPSVLWLGALGRDSATLMRP